jgi:hypothetical protein
LLGLDAAPKRLNVVGPCMTATGQHPLKLGLLVMRAALGGRVRGGKERDVIEPMF